MILFQAKLNLYVSEIGLAHRVLLKDGSLDRAEQILRNYQHRSSDEPELRSLEWDYLWRLCQGDAAFTFPKQNHEVRSLSISRDGKVIATVNESANDTQDSSNSQSGELILYSTVTHERISTRPYNVNHPTSVAFSPATNTLVVGHHDGSIDLWTGDKFQMRQRLDDQHQDKVVAIAFLSSGEFFATAGADQRVMLWSYDENGVVWKSSENLGFGILSLSFNSEGMLAVAGHAAKIVLIEATEEPRDPIPWHNSWVISLSFSPTEPNLLAVGSLDSYFFRCERRRCNSSSYARRRDADIALLDIA